jgi:hypothetical protein
MNSIGLMRELIREELVDACHITVATPYPGTPLNSNPAAYGLRIVDHDFDNYMSNGGSLGIGRPVIESDHLTRDHIFMFWQLAHAAAAEEFTKRYTSKTHSEHYIPSSLYTTEALTPNRAAAATANPRTPIGARGGQAGRDPKPATRTMIELKRSRRVLQYGAADAEPPAS